MATNFKKLTGDLAQTSVGRAVTITGCSTTTGSPAVSATGSLAGAANGQTITGAGIPTGTTILSIGTGTLTLSANATATAVVPLTTSGEGQVVGLMGWEITEGLKTAEGPTTDDAAWESSLPSTKNWTVSINYVYYDGDASQRGALFAPINLPGVVSRWNFFIDPLTSDDAWTGDAYITSLKWGAKVGEIVKIDLTLKGTGPLLFTNQITPAVNTNTNTGLQAEV